MNKNVYMHATGNSYLRTFNSRLDLKKLRAILKSRYLLSLRLQKIYESHSFSGLDYVSLCDFEKRNLTSNNRARYNAYYSYIRNGISLAFDKEALDSKYNVIIPELIENIDQKDIFEFMKACGNLKDRYSDLPDEVQVKDKISLEDMSFITYPTSEYFSSRLFIGRDSKRRNLIKEINELKNILLSNGYDIDIYDIDSECKLDEEGIEKVLSLHK